MPGGPKVDPQEQKKALRQEVWANVKVFVIVVAALRAGLGHENLAWTGGLNLDRRLSGLDSGGWVIYLDWTGGSLRSGQDGCSRLITTEQSRTKSGSAGVGIFGDTTGVEDWTVQLQK
ncbi:hypothetical protein Bbelb_355060 [Branchiostoma belcheri]|nr:hypothetical protein Bbelb_355060 [Branchiostoma belcheri]